MKKIIPELYSTGEKLIYYREKAPSLKSFDLNLRQTCDLDLLLDGSFNPLNGFLTKNTQTETKVHQTGLLDC